MVDDERSAPPSSLDEESAVVVEELVYEMPPAPEPVSPLAPITQPIRVTPPSGDLPIARENVSAPGTLPRLDVSLAGQDPAGAAAILFGEGAASHQGRTRLVLPQPGTTVRAGSPGDFLVPPTIPTPPVPVPLSPPPLIAPVPEPIEGFSGEPALPNDPEESVALLEPIDSLEPDLPIVSLPHYKTIPLPNETAPLSLDELEGAEPWEDEAVLENDAIFDPEGYLGAPAIAEWHETPDLLGVPALDLPEGHERETAPPPPRLAPPIAPNFSSDWPEIETAPIPVPGGGASFLPAPEEEAELPLNPLHEGSFGRLFAQQAPPDQITPGPLGVGTGEPAGEAAPLPQTLPAPSDGDVLDELFYSTPREPGEKKGLSKTAIVVISSMVGVAIFASVGVYFAIKALGGLNPAEAYVEPEGGDPDSASEVGGRLAVKPKGVTVPTSTPDPGINDAPAVIDPVAMLRDDAGAPPAVPSDPPAVSFDEKVQQAVNGTRSVGASVIGSPSLDLVDTPVTNFSGIVPPSVTTPPAAAETPAPVEAAPAPASALDALPVSSLPVAESPSTGMVGPAETGTPAIESAPAPAASDAAPRAADPLAKKDPNFNPPASFAAPGPEDGPLGKTRDVVDAFLRSPDPETRLRYTYQGESLRAAVEDYYQKWPYEPFGRYSLQLNQMEEDTSIGGPYWVFIVATNDLEGGFPIIVRNEGGLLKVDWQVFAEFSDRHFVRFREGKVPAPATFRLIVERFSDYYGSDKEQFKDLKDYYVYQVSMPYGDLNEYSDFAFVEKNSELAKKLDGLVRLGDQALAVVAKLDYKTFSHGAKHMVITELITEGWFN